MMRRRTMIKSSALFGLGALGTSIFSSCGQSQPQLLTSSQPLRVGVLQWFGCEGMFLADKKSYLQLRGLMSNKNTSQM